MESANTILNIWHFIYCKCWAYSSLWWDACYQSYWSSKKRCCGIKPCVVVSKTTSMTFISTKHNFFLHCSLFDRNLVLETRLLLTRRGSFWMSRQNPWSDSSKSSHTFLNIWSLVPPVPEWVVESRWVGLKRITVEINKFFLVMFVFCLIFETTISLPTSQQIGHLFSRFFPGMKGGY